MEKTFKVIEIRAEEKHLGLRLDRFLSEIPEVATRTRAQYLIDENLVLVNSKAAKASYLIKKSDLIVANLPIHQEQQELQAYDFPLEIIYEDQDLLVVNKPAGLVVHPAVGHEQDTLVNALIARTADLSMKFGENRPGIVHRIDKETSGLLVVAKNDSTHEALAQQFKAKTTHRTYFAVVFGEMKLRQGTVQSYLARHPVNRKKYSSILGSDRKIIRTFDKAIENGKWAVTHFQCLCVSHGMSLVKLQLETGRTHQIRVHLSELGYPIVGDELYGADKKIKGLSSKALQIQIKNLDRFLLHAAELGFIHPRTQQELRFKVDWPEQDQLFLHSWDLQYK